jgi:hypothetical protein
MYQTDQSSAVESLPEPATAGTQGFFTGGNPVSGEAATILDADFLNMTMMELINIVEAAGLTPSKTTYNQVLSAIRILMQQAVTNVGVDTGSANEYVVAFTPALSAPIPWVPFWFTVKTANTTTSTLNATGAPKPLVGAAHLGLQGGELIANGNALVYWNPTLAAGSGSYVLMFCSGAPEQIAQATASEHAAQLSQAQGNHLTAISNGSVTMPISGVMWVSGCAGGGGGGGGAGGGSGVGSGGGGGGAGKPILRQKITGTPGSTVTYTIGAAGIAGAAGTTAGGMTDGGPGGDTTITVPGGTNITLPGGMGGLAGINGASPSAGAQGGVGFPNGAYGQDSSSNNASAQGGMGASGPFGGGGPPGRGATGSGIAGSAAYGFGAGGGGGGGYYIPGTGSGGAGAEAAPGYLHFEW